MKQNKITDKAIGVVGGMGPFAGLDLVRKIFENTIVVRDQDHIPLFFFSLPSVIPDRSDFLTANSSANPAPAIAGILTALSDAGATVAGIPCNTAHSAPIFEPVKKILAEKNCPIRIVHIIEETYNFIKTKRPSFKKIGLLATTGSALTCVFQKIFEAGEIEITAPDNDTQSKIHDVIYNPEKGIKNFPSQDNTFARETLFNAAEKLKAEGAQAIILGCTELPMVITTGSIAGLPAINTSEILARALIRETFPEKLKPSVLYDA